MTLREIIDDIKLRLPNPYDEDNIVNFLNKTLRDIQRVAAKADVYEFNTAVGIEMYPLPSYVAPEGIKSVTVGGDDYSYTARIGEIRTGQFYFIEPTGYINIHPVPRKVMDVNIVHDSVTPFLKQSEVAELNPEMTEYEISSEYDGQEANIHDEYMELLPLGVFIIIANASEDINLANNYRIEYNSLKASATQGKYLKRGKYPTTRMVR